MVMMLQRTQNLGQMIVMFSVMTEEIMKFFMTFGIPIIMFLIFGSFMGKDLKLNQEDSGFYPVLLSLFEAFTGN